MVKQDEDTAKKPSSRGRIMQVVEVEEEDKKKETVDATVLVPAETGIEREEATANEPIPAFRDTEVKEEKTEEPEKADIAGSFPMDSRESRTDEHMRPEPAIHRDEEREVRSEPLHTQDKRDIVSELFETKERQMQYPDISLDKKSSPFGFIVWVIVLLAVVIGIGAGLVYMKNRNTTSGPVSSAVPTVTETPSPTASETPMATISGKLTPTPTKSATTSAKPGILSVQVLNGSGESGVASTMKKFLEGKGYTVTGTGNAKNFEYAKTEIIIKSSKASQLDKLKSDLSSDYTVGSTSSTLDAGAAYDAQVIIGKE